MTDLAPLTAEGEIVEETLPDGRTLRFENLPAGAWRTQRGDLAKKPRRRYLLDGRELPSVTTVLGVVNKPALVAWAEREGIKAGVIAERMGELDGLTEHDDWINRARELRLGALAERDRAAERGTAIHTVMHRLALGHTETEATEDLPEECLPFAVGALKAWEALDVVEVLAVERIVCQPQDAPYAGRFDLLLRNRAREVVLADYKTALKGRIYAEAHAQTRAYAECLAFSGLPYPDRIVIVCIKDDGTFEIERTAATRGMWERVLETYVAMRELNDAIKVMRAAA